MVEERMVSSTVLRGTLITSKEIRYEQLQDGCELGVPDL